MAQNQTFVTTIINGCHLGCDRSIFAHIRASLVRNAQFRPEIFTGIVVGLSDALMSCQQLRLISRGEHEAAQANGLGLGLDLTSASYGRIKPIESQTSVDLETHFLSQVTRANNDESLAASGSIENSQTQRKSSGSRALDFRSQVNRSSAQTIDGCMHGNAAIDGRVNYFPTKLVALGAPKREVRAHF